MPRFDPSWLPRRWTLLVLVLVLALSAAARLSAMDVPLERDEGEYAYGGQLLLRGVPPYAAAYNMKFPGIYLAYAAMMGLFGESTRGVHIGLLIVNAAAILLVYLLGTWLSGRLGGVAAAACYAVLSASPSVLGLAAHATHFVVVPALAGVVVLVRARSHEGFASLLAAGFCLGVAVLMKQHAALFAVFGIADVLVSSRSHLDRPWIRTLARAGAVALGILIPLAATAIYLLASGVFERFWFWTVEYARVYAAELSPAEGWESFTRNAPRAVGPSALLWLLAGAGAVAIWLRKDRRDRALWISGFALCSFAATVPGFWFREHYFIVLLPAVALLAGTAVVSVRQALARGGLGSRGSLAVSAALLVAVLAPAVNALGTLLRQTPVEMSRTLYGVNPFPESVEISRHIAANSRPDARVAVLGSEPQIYFYTGRRSATGYIYTYGLMELVRGPRTAGSGEPVWVPQPYARRMQEEMIREIEAAQPEYIVFAQVHTSWLAGPESDMHLMDWSRTYVGARYDLVGVADILDGGTEYRWGEEAVRYTTRSPEVMYVFRKRTPPGSASG